MKEKINVEITGLQATMLIPLRGRAQMSNRFPELYYNKNDIDITNKLNFDFTNIDNALGEYGNLCYIVRALASEKMVTEFLERYPNACVVNIGSGLDTTFHHIDNGTVSWYNLDLPDSMEFRNLLIENEPRCHSISKSVFDIRWFEEIDYAPDKGLLLIAAGVFHFLPENELRKLFTSLSKRFHGAELFFDINSSVGNEYSNKIMLASGNTNASLIFSVDDAAALEQWADNIKIVNCNPYFMDIPRYEELETNTKNYMNMADTNGISKFIQLKFT